MITALVSSVLTFFGLLGSMYVITEKDKPKSYEGFKKWLKENKNKKDSLAGELFDPTKPPDGN